MTKNAKDCKRYVFFLHWIWPKMTIVNVTISMSMTENDFWVLLTNDLSNSDLGQDSKYCSMRPAVRWC